MRYIPALLALLVAHPAPAQGPKLANVREPILRLEAGGPTSAVTAMAFSPDGKTLYAAGFDKVVRVWKWDENAKSFQATRSTYRVPIGPGHAGALNALAVSPDGAWLAVGGLGMYRGHPGYDPGIVVPAEQLSKEMREDQGNIFVFRTGKASDVRLLRGHLGPVMGLAFVQQQGPPLLISAARDWDADQRRYFGSVQVWDVAGKKSIGWLWPLADPGGKRPGLAARRIGKDLRIAIAWDDGTLKIWTPQKGAPSAATAGHYTNTAVFLPSDEVLTMTVGQKDVGKVEKWQLGKPDTVPIGRAVGEFAKEGLRPIPRALGLVSSGADGVLDHAAVMIELIAGMHYEYKLQLVPLDDLKAFNLDEAVSLWPSGRQAVLATAPNGEHVAVAGMLDHSIRVYAVADLLKKRNAPQELRSIGAPMMEAAFVTRGKDGKSQVGLVLTEAPKKKGGAPRTPQKGDLIFDINGRALSADVGDWKTDAPKLDLWTVDMPVKGADPKGADADVRVTEPDGNSVVIKQSLKAKYVVTDFALRPPQGFLKVPIVAIALLEDNQPRLRLYHGGTGEHLCNLDGHQSPIRSVAFSGDGRLLVSVADDQTVCVWSLYNFEKLIGIKGQMHGVTFDEKGNTIVVGSVDETSKAAGILKPGDVVEGVFIDGKLKRARHPMDLINELLLIKPGDKAKLQLGGGKQVDVVLEQSVLARTPLLTLFVTRGDKIAQREWIAWHPLGPYDSSHPRAARVLGWHWNAGDDGMLVKFAEADVQRVEERREGLLPYIIARGSLAPALEDWKRQKNAKPLAAPEMTLGVDGMERGLVREPEALVRLRIDGVPADMIGDVEWQLDGGKWQAFAKPPQPAESALDYEEPAQWKRGTHLIRARMRTRETTPQEFVHQIVLRYQPPPPTIAPQGEARQAQADKALVVDKETFVLEALVTPGRPDEEVAVELFHQQRPLDGAAGGLKVKREVKLAPGDNRLSIVAVHKKAPAGAEARERQELVVNIKYVPTSAASGVPAPLIALESIGPLGADSVPIVPGQPVVVVEPKVLITGMITAQGELIEATGPSGALVGFAAGKSKEVAIAQEVELKPGRQELKFRAQAKGSEPRELLLAVDYRPRLPATELVASPAGPMFDDEGSTPEVRLTGKLFDQKADAVKLAALVLHNDREVAATIKGQEWEARIKLEPGPNRFQVKLKNEWHEAVSGDLQLFYLRPPRNIRAEVPAETKAEALDLVAQIDSSLPINKGLVRATNNRKPITDIRLEETKAGSTWAVHLKVPLGMGTNEILLDVSNAEGICREPGQWRIERVSAKPVAAPPVLSFLEPVSTTLPPDSGLRVSRSEVTVKVRARSSTPLKSMALTVRRNGQVIKLDSETIDVAQAKVVDDLHELTVERKLVLPPGVTELHLEAENDSATASLPPLLVNHITLPLRVVFSTLEPEDPKLPRIKIVEDDEDPRLSLAHFKVALSGKVVWEQPVREQLARREEALVYVNGALQWRQLLDEALPGTKERAFKAELVLDRAKENEIEIELPGLRLDENTPRTLQVGCLKPMPEEKRWLHVQVISPGEQNEKQLLKSVMETLQLTDYNPARREYARAGFERVRLYSVLSEDVDEDVVTHRLQNEIRRNIAKRAQDGWPNDILLLYYAGGEAPGPSGRQGLLTYGTPRRPLIARERVERAFGGMNGVKVLALDVTRDGASKLDLAQARDEVSKWLDRPQRHALLRNAWLGDGETPEEATLLTSLHDALPKSSNLRTAADEVDRRVRQLSQRYGLLRFEAEIPASLARLPISGAGR